jgi:uncharacterized membrane protein (UPF0127 family)
MNGLRIVVSLALTLAWVGCGNSQNPSPSPSASPPPAASPNPNADLPTEAQPKLRTLKLWLGAEEMAAELALTARQQQTGMMFRTNMAENEGMLFPMSTTRQVGFWMKNCPLSLSVAYIDPAGVIQEIHPLEANNTNVVMSASDNIRFVLEASKGWFDRHHIGVGTSVRTERGTLMETFFGR